MIIRGGQIKPRKDDHLMIASLTYIHLSFPMGFQKRKYPKRYRLSTYPAILGKSKKEVVQPYYYVQFDNHATGYRAMYVNPYICSPRNQWKIDETVLYDRTKDPINDNIAGQSPSGPAIQQPFQGMAIPYQRFICPLSWNRN